MVRTISDEEDRSFSFPFPSEERTNALNRESTDTHSAGNYEGKNEKGGRGGGGY